MALRWGPGPVFVHECIAAARRRRTYVARAVLVGVMLYGMHFIYAPVAAQNFTPLQLRAELPRVALRLFEAITVIQLAAVALLAPAATAGAICVDKARGTLLHVFVTDLRPREIVFGKLAARLVPILTLLTCTVPVLALIGLLGGIDLPAAVGAYLVAAGVAVLGSALALYFSVWARKPHQALLPAYALLLIWGAAYPWAMHASGRWPFGPQTTNQIVGFYTNPYVLTMASFLPASPGPLWKPPPTNLGVHVCFLAASAFVGLVLVELAAARLRPVALRSASRRARRARPGLATKALAWIPGPSLDENPVLWREWHRQRPGVWIGRLWLAYGVCAFLASALVVVVFYLNPGPQSVQILAGRVNGLQVTLGLLLLSVSAAQALAEERDRGSLDVMMTTPLSSAEILWGKWWGTVGIIPRLVILPLWVASAQAMVTGRWEALALVLGLIVSCSAAITSLGLLAAVWVPKLGRAVAISVGAFAAWTLGLPIALHFAERSLWGAGWMSSVPEFFDALALLNPYTAVADATELSGRLQYNTWNVRASALAGGAVSPVWVSLWVGLYTLAALVLAWLAALTFDRCLGRVRDRSAARELAARPASEARKALGVG